MPRLTCLIFLTLAAVSSAAAQGPCAGVEVKVLDSGSLGADGATVSFHHIVAWESPTDTTVAYSIEAAPSYTGMTTRGVFRKRNLDVTEYEIRARGRDGSRGSARVYCASGSSSRVVIRLRE